MHSGNIETPADFAEYLTDEESYWPDDKMRPSESDIEVHPQGQVYIDVDGLLGPVVMYLIRRAESSGLRVGTGHSGRMAIFEKRPRCAEEGCYARAQGGSKRGGLCAPHASEAKRERMRQGLPPVRGEDY